MNRMQQLVRKLIFIGIHNKLLIAIRCLNIQPSIRSDETTINQTNFELCGILNKTFPEALKLCSEFKVNSINCFFEPIEFRKREREREVCLSGNGEVGMELIRFCSNL